MTQARESSALKLDVRISPTNRMRADADLILLAERLGFAAAWVAEHQRNPFFSLTIAANETDTIQLGTRGAVAFPRSPMVTAQIAWDLTRQSGGRFCLGLDAPIDTTVDPASIARMREYIESLRAIWNTFQTDARLRYRGEHYTFRLMAPFFNPGPIEHPVIPLFLSGMSPDIPELAGSLCQGLQVSALHTSDYLGDLVKPAVAAGLRSAGRANDYFSLAVPVMIASGLDDAGIGRALRALKLQIASAAGSPAFRQVAAHQRWDIAGEDLVQLAGAGQTDRLDQLIPDEIAEAIAIVAQPQDVLDRVMNRYAGLADRVSLDLSRENSALIAAIMAGR